mmetsp:Transcript_48746/g.89918  ORF Transcript_48746/g.89918 Transcript_48746/m.89918 type:complete len:383 (+) Transcript_48746:79-1227(+)
MSWPGKEKPGVSTLEARSGTGGDNFTDDLRVVAMPHKELPRPPTVLSPVTAELMEKHVRPNWQQHSSSSETLPPLKQQGKGMRSKSKPSVGTHELLPRLPKPTLSSGMQHTVGTSYRPRGVHRRLQATSSSAPDLLTHTSVSSIAEARQRESIRPSSVACRENQRKEVLTSQAVAAEDFEENHGHRLVEAGLWHRPGSSHRQLENFAVDLERCDHLIRQLAGGVPGTPAQANHGHQVRETTKLPIGHMFTEVGTARHRVADALDNTRIEDTEAVQSSIPMQKMLVEGGKGRERIEIVHVQLLRARCVQLMQGATVESLLENLANQEKQDNRFVSSPPSSNVTQTQWSPDVLLDLLVPQHQLRAGTWFEQELHNLESLGHVSI